MHTPTLPLAHPLLQLAGLSALHTLILRSSGQSADGYGALERLPRLRRLHCVGFGHLPACLSRLTELEELKLASCRAEVASIDAALQPLTRLTSL